MVERSRERRARARARAVAWAMSASSARLRSSSRATPHARDRRSEAPAPRAPRTRSARRRRSRPDLRRRRAGGRRTQAAPRRTLMTAAPPIRSRIEEVARVERDARGRDCGGLGRGRVADRRGELRLVAVRTPEKRGPSAGGLGRDVGDVLGRRARRRIRPRAPRRRARAPAPPTRCAGGVQPPVDAKHERELRSGELGEHTLVLRERLTLAQHLERADRLAVDLDAAR